MKLLLVSLWLAGAAWAEEAKVELVPETTGQTWSVVGPRTVAPGSNVLEAWAGYPSISAGWLRGVSSGINVGARVGFVYGVEGMFRDSAPGLRVQGAFKLRLLDSGKVSLGLTFDPGVLYYASYLQGARWGLTFPVGFRLGIAASSALSVAVLVDVPMWVEFGTFGGFNLPILTGGGVEYFITSQLAVFVRARIGPTLRTGRPAEVTFDAALGLGYRF